MKPELLTKVTVKIWTTFNLFRRVVPVLSRIYEQFRSQKTDLSLETKTAPLSPKQASVNEKSDKKLNFRQQLDIVKEGFSKGVRYDGCTGVPDFNFGNDCCGEHDYHYQLTDISRAEADKRLRQCLRQKGYFLLPWIYWLGVRAFGRQFYRKKQDEVNR